MASSVAALRPRPDAEVPVRLRRVGVIDVGSNTARLVVYEAPEGGLPRAIAQRKEVPRMGEGVGHGGQLSAEAVGRGLSSLRRFARTLEGLGRPPVVAVATSAVRDAADGAAFVSRVVHDTGIPLRILSGEEEGRYGYLGVASAWELNDDLVADLGGGSMQIATVHHGAFRSAVSLPLGALRLTEEFLAHDPPKPREVDELRTHVRAFLEEKLPLRREPGRLELHGVGGTIRTLARVSIDLKGYPLTRVHGYPLRRRDLEALAELLTELPAAKRREVRRIGGDRADVIVAGLHTILELLRATDQGQIRVSGMGIRDGLAHEALGLPVPAPSDALVLRSARTASHAFGYDLPRSEALARRTLRLFEQLAPDQAWGASERRAVRAAALFHDAGAAIDLWGHARHTSYLLRHLPVVGLDHREILLASLTAYQHEGDDLPNEAVHELKGVVDKDDVRHARQLGVVLYAAETLVDDQVRFQRGSSGALTILLSAEGARGLSPRSLSRLRKPLKRAFDLEVEVRGGSE